MKNKKTKRSSRSSKRRRRKRKKRLPSHRQKDRKTSCFLSLNILFAVRTQTRKNTLLLLSLIYNLCSQTSNLVFEYILSPKKYTLNYYWISHHTQINGISWWNNRSQFNLTSGNKTQPTQNTKIITKQK